MEDVERSYRWYQTVTVDPREKDSGCKKTTATVTEAIITVIIVRYKGATARCVGPLHGRRPGWVGAATWPAPKTWLGSVREEAGKRGPRTRSRFT